MNTPETLSVEDSLKRSLHLAKEKLIDLLAENEELRKLVEEAYYAGRISSPPSFMEWSEQYPIL